MAIPRNLSNLAPGADTSGVLGVAKGGTGAASLTANNVLLGNGTSAVQLVAPGTSGNVLTSNGTTWASSTPATGAMTLISTQTPVAGSYTLEFTGLSGYSNYLIIANSVTVGGSTNIDIKVGTGAGPTYITSGYNGTFFYMDAYNSNNASTNNAVAGFRAFGAGNGGPNATSPGFSGCVNLFTTSTTTTFLSNATYPWNTNPSFENLISGGRVNNSGNITAIKFQSDLYTFSGAGKISLYGISV